MREKNGAQPVRGTGEHRSPRQFGLKAGVQAGPEDRDRPINRTFGPEGEVSNDGAEEDAAAEWLAHVRAGRIGSS